MYHHISIHCKWLLSEVAYLPRLRKSGNCNIAQTNEEANNNNVISFEPNTNSSSDDEIKDEETAGVSINIQSPIANKRCNKRNF